MTTLIRTFVINNTLPIQNTILTHVSRITRASSLTDKPSPSICTMSFHTNSSSLLSDPEGLPMYHDRLNTETLRMTLPFSYTNKSTVVQEVLPN